MGKFDHISSRMEKNKVSIFLFHGVIHEDTSNVRNYTGKHILSKDFDSFLKACMANGGTPISLDQLIDHQENGTHLPEKPFSITFDDGFLNNMEVAVPILTQNEIPATFYITTDFIENNRMSWVDRIEYVFEEVPEGMITLPSGEYTFSDISSKILVLDKIRQEVKSNSAIIPDTIATTIQKQLGFPTIWSSPHILDQKLNWQQVIELENTEGMTVGGHTHTHAILGFLDENSQKLEIDTSLKLLKEKAGIQSHHYSYPEGQAEHFNTITIQHLMKKNIKCCPTAIDGNNEPDSDLFNLQRIMIQ